MGWLELGIEFQLQSFISIVSTGLMAASGRTTASLLLSMSAGGCVQVHSHQHELRVLFKNL